MAKIAQEYTQKEILNFLKNPSANSDFGLAVQMGYVKGVSFNNKFGRNPATATGDCIWQNSTAYASPTAGKYNFASTSADDDGSPAGVGAHVLFISGINPNYDEVSEYLTLNGMTNVLTSNEYIGFNRAYVYSASTESGAVGTITGTHELGVPVLCTISPGINQTQSSVFIVPRGKTAFFNLPQVTVQNTGVNNTIHIALIRKDFGGVFRIQNDSLFLSDSGGNYQHKSFGAPLIFPSMCTIFYKCITAAASYDVVVDYDIWLVDNKLLKNGRK